MSSWEGLVGLCARARRLQSGSAACIAAIRSGEAKLLLLDEAASENTQKMFRNACEHHGVPWYLLPPHALGRAIGRADRMAAAVTDAGFARKMAERIEQENTTHG